MKFTNTELEDLKKLADAYFDNLEWQEDYEYGAPGMDQKRPFGNSSVELDVLEIIGADPEHHCKNCGPEYSQDQLDYAENLFKEKLIPYLKYKWKELN